MALIRGRDYEIDDYYGYIPHWDLCRGGWNLADDNSHVKVWHTLETERKEQERVALVRTQSKRLGMPPDLFSCVFLDMNRHRYWWYAEEKAEPYMPMVRHVHATKWTKPKLRQFIVDNYDMRSLKREDGVGSPSMARRLAKWVNKGGLLVPGQQSLRPRKLPVQTAWETYRYAA